ncbi:MAG: cell wall-binding repeat-containing protein [Erysipelotrichaceae bacterium]|nr:cell wall-binding repeat-containing protein [Erysipelotrichaceae bacterium]
MDNSKTFQKLITLILSLLLVFNTLGVRPVSAEEPSLHTDHETPDGQYPGGHYDCNDPIIVTATGGEWVAVYKKGEDPTTKKSDYFYSFDVDGQAHNLYNEAGKGTRNFVATTGTPFDLEIMLFATKGDYSSRITSLVVHIDTVATDYVSTLEVPETVESGAVVPVTSASTRMDANVAIYKGTFELTDSFGDNYVEKYYQAYVENKGKDVEGLEDGEYTAVLSYNSGSASKPKWTAEVVKHFTVGNPVVDTTITTDKNTYDPNEPIIVTTEEGKWVRVYRSDEDPIVKKEAFYYSFEVDGESHNIYNGIKGDRGSSFFSSLPQGGQYFAALFSDDTYDTEIARVNFAVRHPASADYYNSISVDPAEYEVGDRVYVAASCNSHKAHVGILEGHHELTAPTVFDGLEEIRTYFLCYINNEGTYIEDLPAGQYTAVMFGSETQKNAINVAYFEVKEKALITTDKDAYEIGEPVMVKANTGDYPGAWVSLLKENDANDAKSFFWYYSNGSEVNIFDQECNSRDGVTGADTLPAGKYKVAIITTDYQIPAYKSFTYGDTSTPTTAPITTDKEAYELGEEILVTVPDYTKYSSPWVDVVYVNDAEEGQYTRVGWYYVTNDETATGFDVSKFRDGYDEFDAEIKLPGTYQVWLYDTGYIELAEFTVTSDVTYSITKNKEEYVAPYKFDEPVLISATSPWPEETYLRLCDYAPADPYGYDNGYYVELKLSDVETPVDIVRAAVAAGKTPEAGKKYRVYLQVPMYDYDASRASGKQSANQSWFDQQRFELTPTYFEDNDHIDWVLDHENLTGTATFHRTDTNAASDPYTVDSVTVERTLEPTCTEAGTDKYTATLTFTEENALPTLHDTMSFTHSENAEVAALGHAWGTWEVVTPATDTEPGVEKHVCTRCGEEETREIPVVHDHVLVHHEAKDATCEEAGNTEYWECSLCGKYFSDAEGTHEIDDKTTVVVAALGHDWSAWTFDAENHKHSRTCSHDASHVETEDCTPGEAFYEDGKLMHKCTVCEGEWVEKVVLSTDKKEYDLWEQIMVTVNGEFGPKDWVGIYKKGDHYGDSNPKSPHYDAEAVKSIFWYYISEEPNPTDILRTRNENEREADYGPGEFTIYLFANGAYELITSVDVTVTEESVEIGDYVMKLNGEVQTNGQHTDLTVGDEAKVNITVDGQTGTSWVGLYNTFVGLDQDFTQFTSTDWYWVRNHNGEDYSFPELDTSVPGEYTVVLFGNGGHDDARMAFTFKISKKIKEEVVTQEPTCTRPGNKKVTYDDGTFENIVIPALGHDYQFDSWIWEEDFSAAKAHFVCTRDEKHTEDVNAEVTSETGEDKIVYTAKAVFEGKDYTDVKEAPIPEPVKNELIRLSGTNRYRTAMLAAEELKAALGVDKFDNAVLATGVNFADALGGGYLAAKKSAPILLTNDKNAADVNAYINENLKEGGTVYVLGGTGAVSEEALKGISGKIVRLSGKTRYDTNLAILNEAGVSNEEILIASGENFADALAASASGRPMLLVNTKKNVLTDAQKAFLSEHASNTLYILGGTGAVSADIETALKEYSVPERVKGASRYETSVEIAKKFFPEADKALVAFSDKFPDGLCAGPLAYALKSPILLTKEGKEASLTAYCTESNIHSGYIVGGEAAIPDITALTVFSLPSDTEITVKK